MFEQLKYINHNNEVIDFGKDGIFVNIGALRDYEWKVTSKGNKISKLSRGVQTRKLPVVIMCATEEEGIAARNRLFETFEKDALALQHGKIVVGNYYFRCFVTKSTKADYLRSKRFMELSLTLSSDYPYWVMEKLQTFGKVEEIGDGIDYPFDFSFDYLTDISSTSLFNGHFVPANFKIVVYGPCVNPAINIAGHTYQVDCTVAEGEYLTIDSTAKKIFVTRADGSTENQFNNRNKSSYIFEKIPSGSNPVTWNGDFGFDVVLMEERSEPKWM
jgi:hypothetical protein